MSKPPYDPTLKDAMEEISIVLKKYNVGGFICLGSQSHGEFGFFFPTWSLAKMEPQENGQIAIRIKCKKEEMRNPQVKSDLESTIDFIRGVQDTCGLTFMNMDKLMKELHRVLEIEEDRKWDFTGGIV